MTHSTSDWTFGQQLAAIDMLNELRQSRLVVCKFRSREGGYIRASITQNPWWYSELCEANKRSRRRYPKERTIIKRCEVVRVLGRIADGIANRDNLYSIRLADCIRKWMDLNGNNAE